MVIAVIVLNALIALIGLDGFSRWRSPGNGIFVSRLRSGRDRVVRV